MARFTETVDIRQAPTVTFDASSLVNRLNSFSEQQAVVNARQKAEKSFSEGQASFVEGQQPEFKKEHFFGSISSKSYNEGLRSAYVASIDRDNREAVAKIYAENPDNLATFNDNAEGYKKALLANVDPASRQIASNSIDSLISSGRIKVQTNEIEKNHKENARVIQGQVEAATSDALGFARDGDNESAAESTLAAFAGVDAAVKSGFLSQEQGTTQKREIEKQLTEESFKGKIFDTFDKDGAQAAYDQLDDMSDKRPKGFAPEEWDQFIGSAQTDLNRKLKRQQIDARAALEAKSLQDSINRGQLFSNPNIPADPAKSSQDRKDVNNYYDSVSQDWKGSTNELIEKNTAFVKNTGIVPDSLISTMNAVMRSGAGDQVIAYTDMLQRMQEDTPNSIKDFIEESRAIALQVSDAVSNGQNTELAIEIARKNTYGLTPTQKAEFKKATAKKKDKKKRLDNFNAMVKSEFDPFTVPVIGVFVGAPDIPAGMEAAYMSNFNNFMTLTDGNIEQSEKLAFESTKNVWGMTSTGGKRRFMQYAPESFYHVDGFNDDWIDDQFISDTKALGVEDAILGVDDLTSRSDSPSYPVLAPNSEGILDIIEDESGQPLRFQPDFKETQEYRDVVDAPSKAIEKAEKRRERRLVARAGVINNQVHASIWRTLGIPSAERAEFMATEEGKAAIRSTINNMMASKKIDFVEAKEALKGYEAGKLEDLPGYEILVRKGFIRADS